MQLKLKTKIKTIKDNMDLARAEKILKLSMLQAKINVQKSIYGMNLVKTLALLGAAVSGILNMLGVKFVAGEVSLGMGKSVANHAYLLFGGVIVAVLVYEFMKKKKKEDETDISD